MLSILQWFYSHCLTQEKFWVAVGSTVTAALIYTITRNVRAQRRKIRNLRESLWAEMCTNVESIFRRGVDRPLLFDAMNSLRRSYIHSIKDMGIYAQLQDLYLELEHYSRFVEKVYLTQSGIDRRYVTERQIITCNVFLSHFGAKPVSYSLDKLNQSLTGNAYIERRRNTLVGMCTKNYEEWVAQLSSEVRHLL